MNGCCCWKNGRNSTCMSLPTFNFCFSYWNNKSISFFLISPQSLVSHWSKMSATGQPERWALSSSNARPCFLWLPTSFWGCGLFWLSGATSVCRNSAFADYSSSFDDSFFLLCVSWEFGGTKDVWDGSALQVTSTKHMTLKKSQFDEYTSYVPNSEVLEES